MANNNKKKQKIVQVLGPVESLETYVKADWWREIFNANYLRTDGDVVCDNSITESEVTLFREVLGCDNNSVMLDLCCGQGRHTFEFYRQGFRNMYGLDRSHYLINKARGKNRQDGSKITFKEGDARKLPFPPDFFDCLMILGNSYGYFESYDDDMQVLKEVFRVLKPGGKLLVDITDGDYMRQNFEKRSWEWIDKDYFVCRERSLSNDESRLISREVITHTRKGVIADQFYAERLYSQGQIKGLLDESNFKEIEFHNQINVNSQRNQDLGMMACRFVITATVEKEWSRKPEKGEKEVRNVTVIMGDPRLTDKVKPDGSFDDDDFHTINELKKALKGSKDYRFTFLDNHDKMLEELVKRKDKIDFVFNLCDEGYNNEATRELHVPALLELLNIPYTGGTPQCLAFCYDKSLVRGVAKEMDIPVPDAFIIKPADLNYYEFNLEFPVIVKPNIGDSSFGITSKSVCYTINELDELIIELRSKFGYEQNILVESFLEGKDLSVGIIGNMPDNYQVLPIIEEDYSLLPEGLPKICGYEAKWDPQSPYWKLRSIPAELPEATSRFLVASCLKLFSRLECRDYARFDWRVDANGTPRLLEVNPNPGWCWDGHLAKMAKLVDIDYPEMLRRIIKSGEERIFRNFTVK